jgi:hypothetical protein
MLARLTVASTPKRRESVASRKETVPARGRPPFAARADKAPPVATVVASK